MQSTESTSFSRPNKERLLAVMRHELPDRVPNFEVLVENPTLEYVMGRDITISIPGCSTYDNIDPLDYVEFVTRVGQDAIGINFMSGPFKEVDAQGNLRNPSFKLEKRSDLNRLKIVGTEIFDSHFELLDRYVKAVEGTDIGLFVTGMDFFTDAYTELFGFENFMYMLEDDLSFVEDVLEMHSNLQVEVTKRIMEYPLTFFYPADDLAYKSGTIISPNMMREIWVPRMQRIFDVAHAKNVPIVFHSDGNIQELIPDLIKMGISVLNPLEPYGMDIREIKKKYGKDLTLMGNMDVGDVLSVGTVERTIKEAKELIDDIGKGGNYILATCHSVTKNVKPENFLAMVHTAQEYGRY